MAGCSVRPSPVRLVVTTVVAAVLLIVGTRAANAGLVITGAAALMIIALGGSPSRAWLTAPSADPLTRSASVEHRASTVVPRVLVAPKWSAALTVGATGSTPMAGVDRADGTVSNASLRPLFEAELDLTGGTHDPRDAIHRAAAGGTS